MFPRLPSIRLYSIQRQYGWLPKAGTKPCQFRPICQNITLTVRHYCSPPRKFNPVTSANDQIQNSRWKKFWKKFDDFFEPKHVSSAQRNKNFLIHCSAFCILFFGVTYGSVPLYRIFCQANALGGEIRKGHDSSKVATMKSNKERLLTVRFEADTSASMQWNFRPQQKEVKLYAGETALAFYSAKNATAKPIDGISTYNVIPYAAGLVSSILLCFKTVLLAKALGRKQCIN